jgi:cytochrome P450
VQRRFALKTLKDFGLGRKSIEESIHVEIAEMMDTFVNTKGDVELGSDFNVPIINILWQIVAGARFNLDNPRDASIMENVRDSVDQGLKTFLIPHFLAKMFPKLSGLKRMKEGEKEMMGFLGEIIKEHEQNLDRDNPKDFIDAYLVEAENHGDTMHREELMNCIWDFIIAGTETSSTTLKWALLYLTLHPAVQDR